MMCLIVRASPPPPNCVCLRRLILRGPLKSQHVRKGGKAWGRVRCLQVGEGWELPAAPSQGAALTVVAVALLCFGPRGDVVASSAAAPSGVSGCPGLRRLGAEGSDGSWLCSAACSSNSAAWLLPLSPAERSSRIAATLREGQARLCVLFAEDCYF